MGRLIEVLDHLIANVDNPDHLEILKSIRSNYELKNKLTVKQRETIIDINFQYIKVKKEVEKDNAKKC